MCCKSFKVETLAVEETNYNSLENIHGSIKRLHTIAQGHYRKFTEKVLDLLIDSRKLQIFFSSNDLQYMVGEKSKLVHHYYAHNIKYCFLLLVFYCLQDLYMLRSVHPK